MYRTLVIVRHTFLEAVVQPIFTLLLAIGVAILVIFGMLPFFTLGEDTIMFKSVGLDIILILVLVATLFATSKSIFEEIEDRTMLTLMSKPVKRWEVMVGKYFGIVLAALLAVAILGTILILCTWWRLPGDYMMRTNTIDDNELKQVLDYRKMHIAGLIPSLFLAWLQISVLAAVSVAISTRFSLVVNLPAVIILYIAGNLMRFAYPIVFGGNDAGTPLAGKGPVVKGALYLLGLMLPFLETFDLRNLTIFSPIKLFGTEFYDLPKAVPIGQIWQYVGVATLYAIAYSVFALSLGMLSFQSRELGGAEG